MTRARLLPLALLVAAPAARASPVTDVTGAVGGTAGAQGVVTGASAASTVLNPALLVDADEEAALSFSFVSEQIGVTLDGRRGGDVPIAVGGRDVLGPDLKPIPNDAVPTEWLRSGCAAGTDAGSCPPPGFPARPRQSRGSSGVTRTYLTLGVAKQIVRDRFAVGLYAVFPLGDFTTAAGFYPDEREALFSNSLHPELYGDRLTAMTIASGASFRLLPRLTIGAAIALGISSNVASASYVRDPTNYDTLLLDNAMRTDVSVAPTFGVRWSPLAWLRAGVSAHAPSSFDVDTTIAATLPSGTESTSTRHDVFDWTPWSFDVGVELDALRSAKRTTSVAASARAAFWSAYVDRHGQHPNDYGADLGWHDTVSWALGVRHVVGRARGFVDLTYVPTPVPAQVGRSSYVDDDRVGLLAGADLALDLGPVHVRPGVQLFVHRLVPRHQAKDDARIVDEVPDGAIYGSTHDPVPGAQGLQTNNPGWPGFASAGWLLGGAITLGFRL